MSGRLRVSFRYFTRIYVEGGHNQARSLRVRKKKGIHSRFACAACWRRFLYVAAELSNLPFIIAAVILPVEIRTPAAQSG
jgi:hypothetical protein